MNTHYSQTSLSPTETAESSAHQIATKKKLQRKYRYITIVLLFVMVISIVALVGSFGTGRISAVADPGDGNNAPPSGLSQPEQEATKDQQEELEKQQTTPKQPDKDTSNQSSQYRENPPQNEGAQQGNNLCGEHHYNGGICSKCNYEWPYEVTSMSATKYSIIDQAGTWTRPYENNSINKGDIPLGTVVTIVASTKNQAGNTWYKMDNGLWVYSGNLGCSSHSYNGGICKECGYEWPYEVASMSATKYSIIDQAGAWTRPYENNSINKGDIPLGTVVTIVASTKNQAGNTWYKMDNGLWVYSGNLQKLS